MPGVVVCGVREHVCGTALPPCADHNMVAEMLDFCREQAKRGPAEAEKALADRVLHTSPLRVLYNLEVRRRGGEGGEGEKRGGRGGGEERREGRRREGGLWVTTWAVLWYAVQLLLMYL